MVTFFVWVEVNEVCRLAVNAATVANNVNSSLQWIQQKQSRAALTFLSPNKYV